MKKVLLDGIWFDSKLEANHYFYLKHHPKITILELQKTFELLEGFKWFDIEKNKWRKYRDIHYTPDFIIKHEDYDKPIAWESKGFARKDYNLRKKLFLYKYGDEYHFLQVHSKKQATEIFGQLKEVDF